MDAAIPSKRRSDHVVEGKGKEIEAGRTTYNTRTCLRVNQQKNKK